MNSNNYEGKLDNLYNLLNNKLKDKQENKQTNLDELENKLNKLENKYMNIEDKYINLEDKYNIMEKKNIDIEKKMERMIFYMNLLYVPYLHNDKYISEYIFKHKFEMISQTKYKKQDITNKIFSGDINLIKLKTQNRIIIETKKKIKNNMTYIVLTLYDKKMLTNNYSFNYILKVNKIHDYCIEIINDFDFELLYNICINKKICLGEIKVYFYRIDELYNLIHN